MKSFAELAFTPAVQALQSANGSRAAYALRQAAGAPAGLLAKEASFLERTDSFYLATVSETGWPYVQHRGGPRGFLRVLSPTRIAFADFRGNRQMVSAGNASVDDRISLIVVDYPNQRRLKLLGRIRFVDAAAADPSLLAAVTLPGYQARIERVAVIELEAFDWNCPQHITQRFTLEEVDAAARPLRERIASLEAEVAALRSGATSPRPVEPSPA